MCQIPMSAAACCLLRLMLRNSKVERLLGPLLAAQGLHSAHCCCNTMLVWYSCPLRALCAVLAAVEAG
jgi:hypothetical protein